MVDSSTRLTTFVVKGSLTELKQGSHLVKLGGMYSLILHNLSLWENTISKALLEVLF